MTLDIMKFAVMQPYFMPYIGYFQLIAAVDVFVIYDNVQYIKNGWINRNRILQDGTPKFFTIPVCKGAHDDLICERHIAEQIWQRERRKLCASIKHAYTRAPFFDEIFPVIENCLNFETDKISSFAEHSISSIHQYLELKAKIINASELPIDNDLKGRYRLWAMAEHFGITNYVNPVGGHDLYHKDEFSEHGLNLSFLQSHLTPYAQTGASEFIPALSIIDVLMNLGKEGTRQQLDDYSLV